MERRKKVKVDSKKTTSNVKKTPKEKITFKSYLRDFLLFVEKNVWKTACILFVIAILLIALSIKSIDIIAETANDIYLAQTTFIAKLQVLSVTLLSGIVPYFYAPVVGFVGSIMSDAVYVASAVDTIGYKALFLGAVPLILNIFIVSVITALGMYICKNITYGYRISSINNMNSLNFRIKIYEVLGKEDKMEELEKKKQEKKDKIISKKEKLNYLQILNIAIVCLALQGIASLLNIILL